MTATDLHLPCDCPTDENSRLDSIGFVRLPRLSATLDSGPPCLSAQPHGDEKRGRSTTALREAVKVAPKMYHS